MYCTCPCLKLFTCSFLKKFCGRLCPKYLIKFCFHVMNLQRMLYNLHRLLFSYIKLICSKYNIPLSSFLTENISVPSHTTPPPSFTLVVPSAQVQGHKHEPQLSSFPATSLFSSFRHIQHDSPMLGPHFLQSLIALLLGCIPLLQRLLETHMIQGPAPTAKELV